MYCPQCRSEQADNLKFCKSCGANLEAVRKALIDPGSAERFDWNKTWLAEMMMSGEESVKRSAELDRLRGITPEVKRRNEIKAGVITASAGLGLMIVLIVLMNGIIATGRVSDAAAEILSRIWIVGVIPILVGVALVFNGMFVSRVASHGSAHKTDDIPREFPDPHDSFLPPAETRNIADSVPFSVTDETTRHLEEPLRNRSRSGDAE